MLEYIKHSNKISRGIITRARWDILERPDLTDLQEKDKPGFRQEDKVGEITVLTWRADWNTGMAHKPKQHGYYLYVIRGEPGQDPLNVIDGKFYSFSSLDLALTDYYRVLKYLRKIKEG